MLQKLSRSQVLFWLVSLFMSAQFALNYRNIAPNISLADYAAGHAAAPFSARFLTAWVLRTALRLFPGPLHRIDSMARVAALDPPTTVMLFVSLLSLLLLIWCTRLFIVRLLGKDSPLAWCSLLVVYIANYHYLLASEELFSLPYDLPQAALFGLAFYVAYTRNRWLYYPLFVLTTLNKETSVFLPLVLFVFLLDETVPLKQALVRLPKRYYVELLVQLAAWKAMCIAIDRFTHTPPTNPHFLMRNLHLVANPLHWPTYVSVFGFLWIPILIFHNRISSVSLRRCLLLAPLWLAAMADYVDPLEVRAHSEWICYVVVCITLILHSSIQFRPSSGDEVSRSRAALTT